jgi:hypothetical protein
MTKVQTGVNGEEATDLVAALISNSQLLYKKVSRLHGDVDRLHRKINATHVWSTAFIAKSKPHTSEFAFFRSQSRVGRRG